MDKCIFITLHSFSPRFFSLAIGHKLFLKVHFMNFCLSAISGYFYFFSFCPHLFSCGFILLDFFHCDSLSCCHWRNGRCSVPIGSTHSLHCLFCCSKMGLCSA